MESGGWETSPPLPSNDLIQTMMKTLHGQKKHSQTIGKLLRDDWQGRFAGPSCWWQDNLKQVKDSLGDQMPRSAVARLIKFRHIHVPESAPHTLCVDLDGAFGCALDAEHGFSTVFRIMNDLGLPTRMRLAEMADCMTLRNRYWFAKHKSLRWYVVRSTSLIYSRSICIVRESTHAHVYFTWNS